MRLGLNKLTTDKLSNLDIMHLHVWRVEGIEEPAVGQEKWNLKSNVHFISF
jgi:hypothetical protein